jgi:NADPH-dependent 7-cyano-7-deazaguanine reductase QueF
MFLEYNGAKIKIKLSGSVQSKCPITGENDYYNWIIEYIPRNKIIEVVALGKYLKSLSKNDKTCEDMVNDLNRIMCEINPYKLTVEVIDESEGIKIEVKV